MPRALESTGAIKPHRGGGLSPPPNGNAPEGENSIENGERWQMQARNMTQDGHALNDNRYIQPRVASRSDLSQKGQEISQKLIRVSIILSNKDFEEWSAEIPLQLKWGDNR